MSIPFVINLPVFLLLLHISLFIFRSSFIRNWVTYFKLEFLVILLKLWEENKQNLYQRRVGIRAGMLSGIIFLGQPLDYSFLLYLKLQNARADCITKLFQLHVLKRERVTSCTVC